MICENGFQGVENSAGNKVCDLPEGTTFIAGYIGEGLYGCRRLDDNTEFVFGDDDLFNQLEAGNIERYYGKEVNGFKVLAMSDFLKDSNPYWHDSYHMGTGIGTNVEVMYADHETNKYLIIIDKATGKRLRVSIPGLEE